MILQPLDYHQRVVDALMAREPRLWDWFQSDQFTDDYAREKSLALDRTAIRLGRSGNAANTQRYALADTARERLDLDANVVLYQSQDSIGVPNAMLHYIPGQITIEFSGRILELLEEDELLDLIGHETAHYKLYQEDGGHHHTAVRLLHWVLNNQDVPDVWPQTARRLSLYTEVYCDTAGYMVTGSRDAAIRSLVKTIGDFRDADAATYLQQAEAILSADASSSRGVTHPELYIRVKALANREAMDDAAFEAALHPLIEGDLSIDTLDILGQTRLEQLTRRLIDAFVMTDACVRTEMVLAHIQYFFPKYRWPFEDKRTEFIAPQTDVPTREYLAYVLLDLATCDRESFEDALGLALLLATQTKLKGAFRTVVRRELKFTTDECNKFERHGTKLLAGDACV